MEKLTEVFNKIDKKYGEKENLLLEKEMIEGTYKDNEILQRYIKIIKRIEKLTDEEKAGKDKLYAINIEMNEPVDYLQGKNVEMSYTAPFTKRQFDMNGFEKVKDKNKWYREIYDKFVKLKETKGNVKIKVLKD